jgi:hypothetical protein
MFSSPTRIAAEKGGPVPPAAEKKGCGGNCRCTDKSPPQSEGIYVQAVQCKRCNKLHHALATDDFVIVEGKIIANGRPVVDGGVFCTGCFRFIFAPATNTR